MIAAMIIGWALAGLFLGYASHQRIELREAKCEISAMHEAEVGSASRIAMLQAQIEAHETSLNMIMKEMSSDES